MSFERGSALALLIVAIVVAGVGYSWRDNGLQWLNYIVALIAFVAAVFSFVAGRPPTS